MTRDIHNLLEMRNARHQRTLRMAFFGFVAGVTIGSAFLFFPALWSLTAERAVEAGASVVGLLHEPSARSAAAPRRITELVVLAPAEVRRSACGRVSVHDGDTFRCDGIKVRLVAASGPVDAPEMPGSPRCEPGRDGWCDPVLARQARDRLRELLATGPLRLNCAGTDRYGRSLCRATFSGRDVGDTLVEEGLAAFRDDWR